jgi:pimeloyl-ACP methyl ester carboxylesterase
MMKSRLPKCSLCFALLSLAPAGSRAAEDWEEGLQFALAAEHSQTRYDGLSKIDCSTVKGLRALWKVLLNHDPDKFDWYVRQGAQEALLAAKGKEAEEEIERVLKGSGQELAKEAILYSIVTKIREEVVKTHGGNDDRKREEIKYQVRKARGIDYFELVVPVVEELDKEGKYLKWMHLALADKSARVRLAAITGLMNYPAKESLPLLLDNLKKLEKGKAKSYREWVLTRSALETLTGQYFRDNVGDWLRWWDVAKESFSIKKRIEEKKEEEAGQGKTVVVKREGVEVTVHMKIAGKGYPLLVLPWQGYEVDYFRPYFHGIEEFCKVYFIRMPQIDEYKGLQRDANSNFVNYPTKILANALVELVKDSGLEKFALLAHGWDASHLAMLLSAAQKGKVTHLILLNPWPEGASFVKAMDRMKREGTTRGNQELVKTAEAGILDGDKPKYVPVDAAEGAGMSRARHNQNFADPTEPEVGALEFLYELPGGTSVLVDPNWKAREILKGNTDGLAAMIIHGERSGWTSATEASQVAGLFQQPKAKLVSMKGSAEFPFMEETYAFTKHMEGFLKPAIAAMEKEQAAKSKKDSKTK